MKKLWTILALTAVCMFAGLPLTVSAAATVDLPIEVEEDYTMAQGLLAEINKVRVQTYNRQELQMDTQLQDIAMQRAAELVVCFSHGRPQNFGEEILGEYPNIRKENIAQGQGIAKLTYLDWDSDPQHAGAMYDASAGYCGIGCVLYEGTRYWAYLSSIDPMGSVTTRTGTSTNRRTIQTDISKIEFKVIGYKYPGDERDLLYSSLFYGDPSTVTVKMIVGIDNFCMDTDVGDYWIKDPGIVTLTSNNPDIFTVSQDGSVKTKCRGIGSVTVKLNANGSVSDDLQVEVRSNIWKDDPEITVYGSDFYEYTGQPVTLESYRMVDCFGTEMVEGRDYEVRYVNNINPGLAEADFWMLGNYADPTLGEYGCYPYGFNIIDFGWGSGGDSGDTGGGSTGESQGGNIGDGSGGSTGGNSGGGSGGQTGSGSSGGSSSGGGYTGNNNPSGGSGSSTPAVSGGGASGGSAYTAPAPKLPKASTPSLKSTKKKTVTVKWKKKTGISGYQVQYALNKKFTKSKKTKTAKAKKTSLTIKKLKSKKTYYVRIRTYKKANGKTYYGKWSKVKKVKVR